MYNAGNINDPCDSPSILNKLKVKNLNRLVTRHLNTNSLPSKFGQLKLIIKRNTGILVITENKIESSFPSFQFIIEGFSMPYRFNRNRLSGRVILYVCDDIPSKQLNSSFLRI